MLRTSWVLSAVCLLTATALAGCVQDELPPPPGPDLVGGNGLVGADGRDLRTELTAEDELAAPGWVVGEMFGVHIFFGPDDQTGVHQNTVVVEDRGNTWLLASDKPETAREHAVADLPIFGEVSKSDLSSSAFGGEWRLFDFPLKDGKTWKGRFTVPGSGTPHDVVFTVAYAPKIMTPEGERPGFEIEGRTADTDALLLEYSYTPSIGWFAHVWIYDVHNEGRVLFHVMNMGHSYDWSGTYYLATATQIANVFGHVAISSNDPTQSAVNPDPYTTFKMSTESTHLFGRFFAFAAMGGVSVIVVDPENEVTEYRAGAIRQGAEPVGADVVFTPIDRAAIAGEWRVAVMGAGVVHGAGYVLWEITQTDHAL